MSNIFWKGYSNDDRSAAIHALQSVIAKHGDMVDCKLFSDVSLAMTIEASEVAVDALHDSLKRHIRMDEHPYLHSSSKRERTIFLNISFTKSTGDLRLETPSVPG